MKKWFLIICLILAAGSLAGEFVALHFDASGKTILSLFFSFIFFLGVFIAAAPDDEDRRGGFGGSGGCGAYS